MASASDGVWLTAAPEERRKLGEGTCPVRPSLGRLRLQKEAYCARRTFDSWSCFVHVEGSQAS